MRLKRVDPLDRIAARVEILANGCWRWNAKVRADGYILLHFEGRTIGAHRWVYETLRGPVPSGMGLDHLCHTNDLACKGGSSCPHRACVNPDHLEPVPHVVNVRRGRATGRGACPTGHAYTDENSYRWRGVVLCRACRREYAVRRWATLRR